MSAPRAFVLAACAVALGGTLLATTGCRSVYYEAWEVFGREKRDLLRAALAAMVEDQEDARTTFTTALDRVKALNGFDGGALEAEYDRLKGAQEDAVASAKQIDDRIREIESVAGDLFREWETELGQMQSADLRATSRRRLDETRARYERARASMTEARGRMDQPLALLNDHVLFLKHNLNAAAVGSLTTSMAGIESSIAALEASLGNAIRESQAFLATME